MAKTLYRIWAVIETDTGDDDYTDSEPEWLGAFATRADAEKALLDMSRAIEFPIIHTGETNNG